MPPVRVRASVSRLPIVVVLAVVAIAGFAIGNADSESAPAATDADLASALAPDDAVSTAWSCAGYPVSVPLETQTLTISNLASDGTEVVVTVFPDDGSAPVAQPVTLGPGEVRVAQRSTLGPAGGVVVEAFTRDVVVEYGVESENDFAVGPCATAVGDHWYFAAGTTGNYDGTTGRPVEQWLALFNPFGTDARVEVNLRTDNRAVPARVGPVDVPRRTRVLVPIHGEVVRQPQVAVEVRATVGGVVAEQSMIFGDDSGVSGITHSLGAVAPSDVWTVPDGAALEGTRTVIAIVNPGEVDTEVDVLVSADATPVTVPLARDAVAWVQLGGCPDPAAEPPGPPCVAVPAEAAYATTVVTDIDTPVVVEQLVFTDNDASEGVASVMGTSRPAPGAVLSRAGLGDGRVSVLTLANPGVEPVTADVLVVRTDLPQPPELQGIVVDPGQRVGFNLSSLLGAQDTALVLEASGPVAVTRAISSEGDITRSGAIADTR